MEDFVCSSFSSVDTPVSRNGEPTVPVCLYRATDGKRKISTIVKASDINNFHPAYIAVVKTSMSSLKKLKKLKKKANRG